MISAEQLVGTWQEFNSQRRDEPKRLATFTLWPDRTWAMKPALEDLAAKIYYALMVQKGSGSWFLDTAVTWERRAKLVGKRNEAPPGGELPRPLLILSGDCYVGGWAYQRWLSMAASYAYNNVVNAYPKGLRLAAGAVYKKVVQDRVKEPHRFVFPKYEPLTSSGDRIEWWRWDVDENGQLIIKEERLWTRT